MFQRLRLMKWRHPILVVAVPYIWMSVFFLLPLLIIFKLSFSKSIIALPPVTDLVTYTQEGVLKIHLNIQNYITLFSQTFYVRAFFSSFKIAGIATLLCLIIGFSIAYAISKLPKHHQHFYLLLVILPFWTSFLIRVYAWIGLLSKEGFVNQMLLSFQWIHEPLYMLNTDFAVIVGLVYCYLPFMILPLYNALEKMDLVYLEAAYDLGCGPMKAFWKITVPLAKNGIIAGCTLVFVPAMGEFVIPELLGGPDNLMMGRVIWMEFFNNRDWPLACALSIVMMALFVIPFVGVQKIQHLAEEREEKRRGGTS
jgi:putrescine transport system permease protein